MHLNFTILFCFHPFVRTLTSYPNPITTPPPKEKMAWNSQVQEISLQHLVTPLVKFSNSEKNDLQSAPANKEQQPVNVSNSLNTPTHQRKKAEKKPRKVAVKKKKQENQLTLDNFI